MCQILATLFQVLNPKGQDISLQKGKENFYVVFTCSIKWAREIRKFHVAVGRDMSMVVKFRYNVTIGVCAYKKKAGSIIIEKL